MKVKDDMRYKILNSRLEVLQENNLPIDLKKDIKELLELVENLETNPNKCDSSCKNLFHQIEQFCKNNIARIDRMCENGINTDVDVGMSFAYRQIIDLIKGEK